MPEVVTVLVGFICGVGLMGSLALGYFWWNSRQPQEPPEAPKPTPKPVKHPPLAPKPAPKPDIFATIPPGGDIEYPPSDDDLVPHNDGQPWLDGVGGMVSGQRMPIERPEIMLGRSRICDIQLHDPKVSRQHATLRFYQGNYFIQDMQSSRGTMVNDRVIETQVLNDGDKIRLGDSVVIFRLPQPANGRTSQTSG